MQTFVLVVFGIKINHNAFVVGVLGIWVFALALSIAGPLKYHHDYFVRAGAWCWINEKYDTEVSSVRAPVYLSSCARIGSEIQYEHALTDDSQLY